MASSTTSNSPLPPPSSAPGPTGPTGPALGGGGGGSSTDDIRRNNNNKKKRPRSKNRWGGVVVSRDDEGNNNNNNDASSPTTKKAPISSSGGTTDSGVVVVGGGGGGGSVRRNRRFSSLPPPPPQLQQNQPLPSTTANNGSGVVGVSVSGKDRAAALQRRIAERLAAARMAAAAASASASSAATTTTTTTTTTSTRTTTFSSSASKRSASVLSVPSNLSYSSGSAAAATTMTTTALSLNQEQQQHLRLRPPATKRARVFDLDLSVTKPTLQKDDDDDEVPKKVNPYLSTSSSARGGGGGRRGKKKVVPEIGERDNVAGNDYDENKNEEDEEEEEEILLDSRLAGGRTSKRRLHNKPIRFVEPGTFITIAERKREKAASAVKSGFVSGRKAGTFVRSTGLAASIAGSSTVADVVVAPPCAPALIEKDSSDSIGGEKKMDVDDIIVDNSEPLPPRADEDSWSNIKTPCPLAMEWWDAELLPSKMRRELASKEKNALALRSKREMQQLLVVGGGGGGLGTKKKKSKSDGDDDDDEDEEKVKDAVAAALAAGAAASKKMKNKLLGGGGEYVNDDDDDDHDDNNDAGDNDDDVNATTTTTTNERNLKLVHEYFAAAGLEHCKTGTLVQHPVPIVDQQHQQRQDEKKNKNASDNDNDIENDKDKSKKQPAVAVLHLTKKEMKRQRKLRRAEKRRELQDQQAAGLIPPPQPRLTLSNFMKVLGDQAVLDPSKMEYAVLNQMRARKAKHERMNMERKLTLEQRREKKIRKLTEDVTEGVCVALFVVGDMKHRYHRTKVDLNAQQNSITGGVLECERDPELALVIAEGGPKAIKRYVRLMTVRMKWRGENFHVVHDDYASDEGAGGDVTMGGGRGGGGGEEEGGDGDEDDGETGGAEGTQKFNPNNKCDLIWTGMSKKRAFHSFVFQKCQSSCIARGVLESKGVAHYWDCALAHVNNNRGASAGDDGAILNFKLGGESGSGGGAGDADMSGGEK